MSDVVSTAAHSAEVFEVVWDARVREDLPSVGSSPLCGDAAQYRSGGAHRTLVDDGRADGHRESSGGVSTPVVAMLGGSVRPAYGDYSAGTDAVDDAPSALMRRSRTRAFRCS